MPKAAWTNCARAFTARLTGQPLQTLLCPSPGTGAGASPSPGSGASASPSPVPCPGPSAAPDAPAPGAAAPAPGPGQPSAAAGGWPGALSRVNLVMPAAAWLGLSDAPGEIGGLGAADAGTCRDVASALARQPAAQWCVTLTDRNGRAGAGPGPPGSERRAWLATVKITPIETGTCEHRRESAGYQPSDSLRHIIKIRSPRCGFPGCRRPAVRCDDDHTIPYHQDGRTCECNLYPLCRRHHQTKQADGWQLSQPEPGTLIWTAPSGRQYTVAAEPYPR